jgi:hypothetical protein
MHRQAGYPFATHFDLARVQSGTDVDPELTYPVTDGHGAADGSGWTVEHREEPIPRGVHLVPAEPVQLAPHENVMGRLQPARLS